ncbi:MAG: helix-turn-helix domain-containing protein [Dehalococcoidia bacterium]
MSPYVAIWPPSVSPTCCKCALALVRCRPDDCNDVWPPVSRAGRKRMNELLVTCEEAGRRLHLSRTVVFELLRRNDLESIRIGRSRRIPVQALDAYVQRQREAQAAEVA